MGAWGFQEDIGKDSKSFDFQDTVKIIKHKHYNNNYKHYNDFFLPHNQFLNLLLAIWWYPLCGVVFVSTFQTFMTER